MKEAKLSIALFEVECPYCRQLSEEPFSGSLLWPINEFELGEECDCSECGEIFRLPKRVADNQL